MQRDTSRPRVRVMWAVIVFFALQFFLGSGPTRSTVSPCHAQLPDLYEASIAELQDGLEHGHFTSVDLVKVPHHPTTLY
jgi:amidase